MQPTSRAIPFEKLLWLFPIATTLHNTEEALWLPAWSQRGAPFYSPVGEFEFRFAVTILTLAAIAVTALARRNRTAELMTLGYAGAMLLNVFVPHLAATVVSAGYTPGVATALAINLPIDSYLLRRALREGRVQPRTLGIAIALTAVTLLSSIPVLFWLGRHF